jgi:hypothetical protein
MNSNGLQKGLIEAANYLAEKVKQKLDSGHYPSGNDSFRPNYSSIQDTITVGTPEGTDNNLSITVSMGGENAPYAVAYERGSGIRGEKKEDYTIASKNRSLLAFLWKYPSPLGRKLTPGDEEVAFQEIQHPGIAPQPYLEPTINAEKDEIAKIIGREFKAAILYGQKRVEVIK